MGKIKISREVTPGDVNCLENLVVAFNTVFFMTSIFIVIIAATTRELFFDFDRLLSPSLLLLIVGSFIVLISGLAYVGIAKKSSSLISLYTMLLIFIFVMEVSAGLGILSFRKEIRSAVSYRMKKAVNSYSTNPMTANFVDYVQLELQCCGVNSFRDWDEAYEFQNQSICRIADFGLPPSCCTRTNNSFAPVVNKNGCLNAVSFLLHRSALSLTAALIAVCTIQILGAYFSYTLASTLSKYKIQQARSLNVSPQNYEAQNPPHYNEKSQYF